MWKKKKKTQQKQQITSLRTQGHKVACDWEYIAKLLIGSQHPSMPIPPHP